MWCSVIISKIIFILKDLRMPYRWHTVLKIHVSCFWSALSVGWGLGAVCLLILLLHWHFFKRTEVQRLCWWACLISKSFWVTRKCWWPILYRTWSLLSSTPEKWGRLWSADSRYWGISITDHNELHYLLLKRPYETRDFVCKVWYWPLAPSLGDCETWLSC